MKPVLVGARRSCSPRPSFTMSKSTHSSVSCQQALMSITETSKV